MAELVVPPLVRIYLAVNTLLTGAGERVSRKAVTPDNGGIRHRLLARGARVRDAAQRSSRGGFCAVFHRHGLLVSGIPVPTGPRRGHYRKCS